MYTGSQIQLKIVKRFWEHGENGRVAVMVIRELEILNEKCYKISGMNLSLSLSLSLFLSLSLSLSFTPSLSLPLYLSSIHPVCLSISMFQSGAIRYVKNSVLLTTNLWLFIVAQSNHAVFSLNNELRNPGEIILYVSFSSQRFRLQIVFLLNHIWIVCKHA